ncbi:MAG: TetR/AcrR family transcriptional regulator, partial [Corallococcus sp.]|nr:TetR/AcrR family transcriptional regulator [Corallococcus sp.]
MNKFEIKYNNTAEKMRKALLTLIERKSFKDITISEICSVAKVNRTTFYLHYNNVLDLLTEISDSLVRDFISG